MTTETSQRVTASHSATATATLEPSGTVTVQRKLLLEALRTMAPAVARNGVLEALRCVRLTRRNGHVELQGSNLELAGRLTLPYLAAQAELDVLVPHKPLVEGLRGLDSQKVELRADQSGLRVLNGARAVNVPAPAKRDDFPSWETERGELVLTAPAAEFARQVLRLAAHASKDQTRPVLTGLFLDAPHGRAVSTDSYRLLCVFPSFDWARPPARREGLNLPAGHLAAVVRKWGKRPRGRVELYTDGTQATLVYRQGDAGSEASAGQAAFQRQEWSLRLIQGQYPSYLQLVPDQGSFTLEASVAAPALAETSKAAAKLGRAHQPLRVSFDQDAATCTMQGEPGQPAILEEALEASVRLTSVVPKAVRGPNAGQPEPVQLPVTVGLNPGFLADAAAVMGEGSMRLRVISALKPLLVDAPDEHADWALLMPIRLGVEPSLEPTTGERASRVPKRPPAVGSELPQPGRSIPAPTKARVGCSRRGARKEASAP